MLKKYSLNEFMFITVHLLLFVCFFFLLFRAALAAYGGSQTRGLMGVTAASLHHSHGNTGSKLRLRPTPQLRGNAGSLIH